MSIVTSFLLGLRRVARGRRPLAGRPATGRAAALALTGLFVIAEPAGAQMRVVNYNVAQLQGDEEALYNVISFLNADDWPGFAVAPAVYIMQEVRTTDRPAILFLLNEAAPPGIDYASATYTNHGEDFTGGAQALFYRTDLLQEIAAQHLDLDTGAGRESDRWKLRLLGYNSSQAQFYVYGAHLKASTGAANEAERLAGVQVIRADAAGLPAGSHVIYAGDFNFYSNSEPAYLEFLAPGSAQAFDPLGTDPWSGMKHALKHTQSPLAVAANGLTGGGLDDRFDFQLLNSAMVDGAGLAYIEGTYRHVGNDGLHFNEAVNAGNNFYWADDLPGSNALADALNAATDHLPVVAEYQIPAVMAASLPPQFGPVIVGASVQVALEVSNAAAVQVAVGADVLQFSANGSGSLTGSCSGSAAALAPPQTCAFTVNTNQAGTATGTVGITTSSQAAQNNPILLQSSGTVLRHANGSFEQDADVDALEVSPSFEPDSGMQVLAVLVHNFGFDALQALLDVDGVMGAVAPFALQGALPAGIGAAPGELLISFDTNGLGPGDYPANLTITVSDEDLPGAGNDMLELSLLVTIGPGCPEDLNASGAVDVDDLVQLILAWGACSGCPEDLNGSGAVDVDDLVQLILAWGGC